MLRAVPAGPQVVVCNTCGAGDGARLAAALRAEQATDPALAGIGVEEMPCLFACARACAVHLRAPGRIGYILGDFAPTAQAARAILHYARLHAESAAGEVDYADWPEGVKGHFIARMPPAGFVVALPPIPSELSLSKPSTTVPELRAAPSKKCSPSTGSG